MSETDILEPKLDSMMKPITREKDRKKLNVIMHANFKHFCTTLFFHLKNIAKLHRILFLPDAAKLFHSSPQGWTTAMYYTFPGFLPEASSLLLGY